MKNKLSLKSLCMSVSTLMMSTALTIGQPANATDIEIYKSADEGKVTVMLLLDISGSMNLPNSVFDDYYLRAGNNPFSGANGKSVIATPILDALAAANPNTDFARARIRVNNGGNGEGTGYTKALLDALPDTAFTTHTRAAAEAELVKYRNFAQWSYCQDASVRQYRDPGWQPTLITETAPGGYKREYCRVPKDYDISGSPNFIPKEYWRNNDLRLNTSISDPKTGCSLVGNEYRCYSRISRLKDALYDVVNGNPSKGIAPLGDNVYLGIATLGIRTKYTPNAPWSPNAPLNSAMDMRTRDLGAIRVPARALGATVGGKTQRQILNEFIADDDIFDAHTGTPTARSYAETVSYMMGTTTAPNTPLQERDLFNGITYAHRVCVAWNTSTNPQQCTRFEFANVTLLNAYTQGRAQFAGTNGDQSWIYGIPIPNDRFTGTFTYKRPVDGVEQRYQDRMGMPANSHLMFGYPREFVTGFPYSAVESKTDDGTKYKQPDSLVNQTHPQCSGQGIYVLSDGRPSFLPYEEAQMQRALGSKGSSFQCSQKEVLGNIGSVANDWACMFDLAETIKDPNKNPAGLSFKTAVVGFARQYIDGSIPAYDPSLSVEDNLRKVNGVQDQHNFARWGMRGEGGWYAGTSSQSVIDSINAFVAGLIKDIPDVATGQPYIPIDPLNPLAYMPNAYYGSISPKVNASYSFWAGDMNKYGVKGGKMVDASDNALFNPSTGLLNAGVTGYWGTGMKSKLTLRANNRPVFTNASGTVNTPLTPVTVNSLFAAGPLNNTTYRNAWLNMLGYDVPVNGAPVANVSALGAARELRQLGALLHSNPVILTQSGSITRSGGRLDTSGGRQDYLLYGSTQGAIHVVDTQTGQEKLAFVPYEMMTGSITRPNNRNNFQNADSAVGEMNYGVDGQWTAYTQYINSPTGGFTVNDPNNTAATSTNLSGFGLQWVYGGMRMGGRSYYALDLSNVDAPKLKFHIAPESAAPNTPLYYMGQSWSKPTLGFVRWQGQRRLVMFVGGGYDAGYENRLYDQATANTTGQASGAGVYMFDAHTGSLLWWSSKYAPNTTASGNAHSINNPALQYSIVSNISTFDRDNDGLVDNLIFGDLGGQVFRVDLDNGYDHTDNSKSLATRVVRVYNGHRPGGLSPRFYDAPSLSAHSQEGVTGQFGVISIASGNRSSPLAVNTESARDGLFVIFDHDVLKRGMVKSTFAPSVTDANEDKLTEVTRATNIDNEVKATVGVQGWKFYFTAANGRLKGYSSPRVVDNFLFVSTYTPEGGTVNQNDCSAGVIGESFQEVFCMPGGVCNKTQVKVIGEGQTDPNQDGSKYRFKLGLGIIQAGIGNATKDPKDNNEYAQISPSIDCAKVKPEEKAACLKQIASISNKPVRWYEDTPRTKAN